METQRTLPTVVSAQRPQLDLENLLPPGSKFEKYHVEKLLAKGGMGAVYLVRHEVLDTHFALKVLFPHVAAQNADFVERFIREAKLSSKIRHPNLIVVHDAGCSTETGLYYLVMDYVPNGTLRDRLAVTGRILPCGVLQIIRQIAEALRVAHRCGAIHRDIKPENIMFDENGNARLADLGIAKSMDSDTMLTMAAAVMGTPCYMSPEQAKDSGQIDERADVYSLGVVLYEMLSGHCPFGGNTPLEILSKVISDEKAPDIAGECPDLPPEMASLVHDMIEKDPEKRVATVDVLLSRIAAIEGEAATSAGSQPTVSAGVVDVSATVTPSGKRSHRRVLRLFMAVLGAAVTAIFAVAYLQTGESEVPSHKTEKPPTGTPHDTNKPVPPVKVLTAVTNEAVRAPTTAAQEEPAAKPVEVPAKSAKDEVAIVPPSANIAIEAKPVVPPTVQVQDPPSHQGLLFSPRCRRDSDVMRELEKVISMDPELLRVSLGECAEYRSMSLDSFENMAVRVIERLKRTNLRFVMVPSGGVYGTLIQELSRRYSCDIE